MVSGSLQIKNKRYYMVLSIRNSEGKLKSKWIKTGLPTKGNNKKAKQMLAEYKLRYDDDGYLDSSRILFCDFMGEWLGIKKNEVQITTYDGYKHIFEYHLFPYFKKKVN